MQFEYIPKITDHAMQKHGYYIDNIDSFYAFVDEFNATRVHWGEPTTITARYFFRLLKDGSSTRARGFGKNYYGECDEASTQMTPFQSGLLDNGALWKLYNENVICTALPYGEEKEIIDRFYKMKEEFSYSENLRMQFLDEKYKFRNSGDYMILIYYDAANEEVDLNCSDEELRKKAICHSGSGILRQQTSNSYARDRYVSEYAKRRAHGICQLCGQPAPHIKKDGTPCLETHHVKWLAQGGSDSIDNTVALCPNCHRKMHDLNFIEDVRKLIKVAKEI